MKNMMEWKSNIGLLTECEFNFEESLLNCSVTKNRS